VTPVPPRSAAAGYVPFFHVGILTTGADTVVQGEGGVARVIFTRPELLHGIRAEYRIGDGGRDAGAAACLYQIAQ
jgi:hypothetical protein